MEIKSFSEQELNNLSKDMIIALYMQLSTSFQLLSQQNEQILNQNKAMSLQIENLQENIAILINHRFGRQTEKTKEIFDGQMFFTTNDNGDLILNEAEILFDIDPEEEERSEEELLEELKKRLESRKRKKGVRQEDLRMAKVIPTDYTIPEERLNELFPEGYKELAVKVTRTVEYTPAELVVHEEHIHQYKSIRNDIFVTADHPSHLLDHSILSPSLAAKMINDKFINAVPINRISREFGWLDVVIRPQTMSRWLIRIVDKYFKPVIDRMEYRMMNSAKLIHCDETPFVCEQDRKKPGKSKNSKSYMWVYHTADQYGSPPIFIYQYKDNRRTENVESFLKNYKGILMADGYEPYHIVARKSNGVIVVAGCWAHGKRKFAEIIKADPKNAIGTIAFEGNHRIAEIYHIDNKMKNASPQERLAYRKEKVAPLVDDLFEWAKDRVNKTATEKTRAALQYLINQELYLRAFLTDGMIPLDNSDAERSIRSFCVGKHNWHISATSSGAQASGILYSIAETTKANGLKPYEYFKYLLEELLAHENEITDELIDSLLPWSETIPEEIKAKV